MLTVDAMAASATRSTLAQWSRNRTAIGTLATAASSRKAGGSSSRRRIIRPTTTTTALSQNGTRQPQLSSCSSGIAPIGRNTAVAMIRPACVPLSVKLVKKPRRCSGACSRLSEFAPDCSPEADRPCSSRSATSSTGAQMPIEL